MKLTDDHKIQIFCAALNAIIQTDAGTADASGLHAGSKVAGESPVERASQMTGEAIAKLHGKAYDSPSQN